MVDLLKNNIEPKGRDRLLLLVCFITFSTPFLFGYGTAPLTNFAGEIVAAAGLSMLLLAAVQFGNLDVRSRELGLVLAVFVVLGIATALQYFVFGSNNGSSWLMVGCYFLLACVAAWIGHAAHASSCPDVWIRTTAIAILGGAVFAACASIAQFFGVDGSTIVLSPSVDPGRTFGFIRQPNHQGTFLNMGLAALLVLQFFLDPRRWKICVLVFSPILAFGIVSTGSRTAVVQLIFITLLFSAFAYRLNRPFRFSWLPITFAVTFWFLLYFLAQQGRAEFYGAEKLAQTSAEGLGMRLEVWRQTINLILDRPWFGYGLIQYASVFYLSGAAEQVGLIVTHSHNVLLQLLFGYGIPITAGAAICLLYVLWCVRRRIWSTTGVFAFAILGCVAIHSIFEFPLWYVYFLVPASLCLGWLCYAPARAVQRSDQNSLAELDDAPQPAAKATRLAAVALSLAMMSSIVWINHDYYRLTPVYTAGLKVTLEERLQEANKVFWFRPFINFLTTFNETIDLKSAPRYVDSAAKIGCIMHEIWYQPRTIVALLYSDQIDDVKTILHSYSKLSGGNMTLYQSALSNGDIPHSKEILEYIANPVAIPRTLKTFSKVCFNGV